MVTLLIYYQPKLQSNDLAHAQESLWQDIRFHKVQKGRLISQMGLGISVIIQSRWVNHLPLLLLAAACSTIYVTLHYIQGVLA